MLNFAINSGMQSFWQRVGVVTGWGGVEGRLKCGGSAFSALGGEVTYRQTNTKYLAVLINSKYSCVLYSLCRFCLMFLYLKNWSDLFALANYINMTWDSEIGFITHGGEVEEKLLEERNKINHTSKVQRLENFFRGVLIFPNFWKFHQSYYEWIQFQIESFTMEWIKRSSLWKEWHGYKSSHLEYEKKSENMRSSNIWRFIYYITQVS